MISCFDPLADMTIFLNRPTDVAALKSFVDHRVEETRTRRKEILGDTFELYTPNPVTVTFFHFDSELQAILELQGVGCFVHQAK